MHLKRLCARTGHPHIAIAIILVLGLLLPAIPAQAIYGSTSVPPGKYPYVGGIWLLTNCCVDPYNDEVDESYDFVMPNPPDYPFFDGDFDGDPDPDFLEGPKVRTNGILIAPNVVLTNGAHFRNGRHVGVSFKAQIGDIDPHDDAEFDLENADIYEGYVYQMPGLDRFKPGFKDNDLAVIILTEDVRTSDYGNTLAPLPALNALRMLNGTKTPLTAVSYGPQTEDPYEPADEDNPTEAEILAPFVQWDFSRRQSSWKVTSVEGARIRFESSSPPSYYCDADQGAPFINDQTNTVTALMTFWPQYCNDTIAYGYRLDTKEVRGLFCDVSRGNLVDVVDPNPDPGEQYINEEDLSAPRFVHYPAVTKQSQTVLGQFCGSGVKAASVSDGGKQSADHGGKSRAERHHKAKHSSKHKKGDKHRGKGKRGH